MTTHAQQSKTVSIAAQIAQLPHLPMQNIWAMWDTHFDERPQHHHRTWLESRLAYKIQEKAFGSLKPTTRRKLEEIGETGLLPKRLQGDADRLLPGTMLSRFFDDQEHKVVGRGELRNVVKIAVEPGEPGYSSSGSPAVQRPAATYQAPPASSAPANSSAAQAQRACKCPIATLIPNVFTAPCHPVLKQWNACLRPCAGFSGWRKSNAIWCGCGPSVTSGIKSADALHAIATLQPGVGRRQCNWWPTSSTGHSTHARKLA